MTIIDTLINEFNLKKWQVENVIALIDEGNTIPFISRYRKEATGELNDEVLRDFFDRLTYLRNMEARKEEVKRLIDEQGKLTDELIAMIDGAQKLTEIEDIYRPYKPKRRTRAMIARERGLEPLASIIIAQNLYEGDVTVIASEYINEENGVSTAEDALAGAMDIIAEIVSDNADYRKAIREMTFREGTIRSKATKEEDSVYRLYYDFSEPVKTIAAHRILALNRGEKEEFLNVSVDMEAEKAVNYIKKQNIADKPSITSYYVEQAIEDSYSRLIAPSIEREIRNELSEVAQEQAIKVFKENLKNLLMQPPIRGKVVLGLDPGYRTGCKLAVVDETGKVLDTAVIYPTHSEAQVESAKKIVRGLVTKHSVELISIGNGTASKESEIFISGLIKEEGWNNVKYAIVNEAGASVYSASKAGTEEFPDFDVTQRSAASIARRIQDPLAELVKIDAKSIGVGQYQHDVNQKRLSEALGGIVEDCVNDVGVDLNTASYVLMSYISGINTSIAKNIVAYREKTGKFKSRKELLKVSKLGEKAFLQCAGFMRIADGSNPLDNTSVHPESYKATEKLLFKVYGEELKEYTPERLKDIKDKINKADTNKVAEEVGVGVPTLKDIADALLKPGRDPRDDVEQPILRTDVMDIKDLKPGMELTGTVRNVIDFGAFVDIGVHQDGLVHISQLADKFVKHPMDVVSVGDIVSVRVLEVDVDKKRISLTMRK